MPTLYYSPLSRASRVISQLLMIGKLDQVKVVTVDIIRGDGSGRKDPNNPHPEGKVPFLITDEGETIRESSAIMMYLDEFFGSPLGIKQGEKGRGAFLSWMAYSGGVLEPAMVTHFAEINHPMVKSTFRSMAEVGETLNATLSKQPYLVGDKLTIADMILASAFLWAPNLAPDFEAIKAWLHRVTTAQAGLELEAYEAKALESLAERAG
ncbi:glutathione S-transferase [Pacificibacter maritimus]|uniref:Glutathione S-transferase n=1 Tax=Pacificibacter maritimus TaxID=762213 RepID=A0A3N4VE67_9RHOB|nr:glutathione S-transferase family protein [Pacificibacter maritimus]RPE71234.1 glutathione S-transferase [Pacificibacter maritimus]